ncbi:hypothetical protein [Pseudonocardia sp. GCM10023141]|uniref:hypothetical protein n=1 Tax=Pseudonocardia sp. GCM10023141 TaxID=3252653 RepID=UPI003619F932
MATNWGLSGIGGIATDDLWTVGTVMQHPVRAVTLHYDGHTWQHVPAPTPPHTAVHISDVVALASNDVWAGGHHQTSAERGHQPRRQFAMHWDGTSWSTRDLDDHEGQISQLATDRGRVFGIGNAGAAPYATALTGPPLPALPGPTLSDTAVRSSLHGATILSGGALLAVGATASTRMPLQPLTALMHP